MQASFFEITTLLAFQHFLECNVDFVVLECGLGGRLDATNIIKEPAAAVITSIGFDHQKILGDTIEAIALEKAPIMKKNCPAIVGPNVPRCVMRDYAMKVGAMPFIQIEERNSKNYDEENNLIVSTVLQELKRRDVSGRVTDAAINKAMLLRPSCRFEVVQAGGDEKEKVTVILDVAHNESALASLFSKLSLHYPEYEKHFVVGLSADKDLDSCLLSLSKYCSTSGTISFVQAANSPRAATVETLLEVMKRLSLTHNCPVTIDPPSVSSTLKGIIKNLSNPLTHRSEKKALIVVCGSFYIMSEAREALNIVEPRDTLKDSRNL
jgi:dihydrofolate synthase/folylpolyglutamate synthase